MLDTVLDFCICREGEPCIRLETLRPKNATIDLFVLRLATALHNLEIGAGKTTGVSPQISTSQNSRGKSRLYSADTAHNPPYDRPAPSVLDDDEQKHQGI